MGIAKFFGYLKSNYKKPQWLITKTKLNTNYKNIESNSFKWNNLILDYQSLIYSTYEVFSSEINYFIRILYKNNNHKLLLHIFNKYPIYFSKLFKSSYSTTLPTREVLLSTVYNDQQIIIDTLVDMMIEHTIELSKIHVINKTYIFFDGIPSLSKIKEQASRRIYPDVINQIKNEVMNDVTDCNEKIIRNKLLQDKPPPISIGTEIVEKLREKLTNLNMFYINDVKYGEAEHQIMKYINNYPEKFTGRTLLASPDADLILLSLINSTKGFKIDIYRESTMTEKNNNFFIINNKDDDDNKDDYDDKDDDDKDDDDNNKYYKIYEYIFIEKLKDNLTLDSEQKILDICYILLLLGDDFIPAISTMNIKLLPEIINIYDNIVEEYNDYKIIIKNINNYEINYNNLTILFQKLSKKEIIYEKIIINEFNKRLPKLKNKIKDFQNISKYHFIKEFSEINSNYLLFEKIYLLENGFIINKNYTKNGDNKYNSLFNKLTNVNNNLLKVSKTNDIIINYLEGCKFIFDIYLNNNLNNYKWYYKYHNSPTLMEIYNFLSKNIKDKKYILNIFNYAKNNDGKYLNYTNYKEYSNNYKFKIFSDIIFNITNKKIFISQNNFNYIKQTYLTYNNVEKIFNCDRQIYFNKCINISNPIKIPKKYNQKINDMLLGGNNNYYYKYIKYKNKYKKYLEYLELKTF